MSSFDVTGLMSVSAVGSIGGVDAIIGPVEEVDSFAFDESAAVDASKMATFVSEAEEVSVVAAVSNGSVETFETDCKVVGGFSEILTEVISVFSVSGFSAASVD